mmetsp:Transcript_6527/g.15826  ORF Transcript_6527/g.15826 Transcript_6527/m.15826 type:complete len:218 (-) Transcript_6527:240-893(-)
MSMYSKYICPSIKSLASGTSFFIAWMTAPRRTRPHVARVLTWTKRETSTSRFMFISSSKTSSWSSQIKYEFKADDAEAAKLDSLTSYSSSKFSMSDGSKPRLPSAPPSRTGWISLSGSSRAFSAFTSPFVIPSAPSSLPFTAVLAFFFLAFDFFFRVKHASSSALCSVSMVSAMSSIESTRWSTDVWLGSKSLTSVPTKCRNPGLEMMSSSSRRPSS